MSSEKCTDTPIEIIVHYIYTLTKIKSPSIISCSTIIIIIGKGRHTHLYLLVGVVWHRPRFKHKMASPSGLQAVGIIGILIYIYIYISLSVYVSIDQSVYKYTIIYI